MRLLMIGGTSFSGRALTELALARGHQVTLYHRGTSGEDPFPDANHVHGDRDRGVEELAGRTFDAVVDTCGYVPRAVAASTGLLSNSGWYGYYSSISAHIDPIAAGSDEDAPVHEPPFPDTEEITAESYGPLKAACERVVLNAFDGRAAVIRPGYIVGPHDPTDRFTSWIRRAAEGGEMLAPGPSEGPMQFVDARDLATFVLDLAERHAAGTFDVVHPAGTATRRGVLGVARAVSGAETDLTWVDGAWLDQRLGDERDDVLPMWDPEDQGAHLVDPSRAIAAGLTIRPTADTVRDTLAWDEGRRHAGGTARCGLPASRERELLEAWHAERG